VITTMASVCTACVGATGLLKLKRSPAAVCSTLSTLRQAFFTLKNLPAAPVRDPRGHVVCGAF